MPPGSLSCSGNTYTEIQKARIRLQKRGVCGACGRTHRVTQKETVDHIVKLGLEEFWKREGALDRKADSNGSVRFGDGDKH
jgi:5-methylcytosine-specific restriction endonuclease McrA